MEKFAYILNDSAESQTIQHRAFYACPYVSVIPVGVVKTEGHTLKLGPGQATCVPLEVYTTVARRRAWCKRLTREEFEAYAGIAPQTPPAASAATDDSVACPVCGKACKSEFGLKAHMKSHK